MEKGIVIALAVGSLALSGFMNTAAAAQMDMKPGQVKCGGVNSCKGKSDCKSKDNNCKGMNSCKGKGWMVMDSADACTKKGGTVMSD